LRIVLGGGGAARLFGVPFLLAGLWFGYYLLLSLASFVTGESGPEMIPGLILLIIMTAAFFLPGWALLAARAIVEIDRSAGVVNVMRDLRFYKHRSTRRLSEFSSLQVDLLRSSPHRSGSGGRSFKVDLAAPSRNNQVVGLFDDPDAALAHGRRLSGLLGLPVEDHRYTDRPSDDD
jgi:hypothetical protein